MRIVLLVKLLGLLLLASPCQADAVRERAFDMRRYLLESHPWIVRDLLDNGKLVVPELACMADVAEADQPAWRKEILQLWRDNPAPFDFASAWLARYPARDWQARRVACQ
ncbi:hypothetical protein FNU76_23695 [Chitinimonas arctica]|uniref:Lytic murein transglycosylase n=1 Tax=Chitinimonas arctica TaxID=2594795 RepID=A0A516SLU1_9NEIS|nr:hypothetical protein [Chitinimonas arctica]QDQ29109.1 hypothetical protein FNU76_23695 [Chitinimonas arctica]